MNNLINPPTRLPNRPPGLVQRGAETHHSYQPPPLSRQQQQQRLENTASVGHKVLRDGEFLERVFGEGFWAVLFGERYGFRKVAVRFKRFCFGVDNVVLL